MEYWLDTFLDLQKMILRARYELSFEQIFQSKYCQPLRDFISDCEAFQMNLLRPWDRTD